MRIDRETRRQPVQLVALGGPVDGQLVTMRHRWDEAIVDSLDPPGAVPPLRGVDIKPCTELRVVRTVYTPVKARADRNVMTRRGGESYRVLVPAGIADFPEAVDDLIAKHGTPSVDGGHRYGKTDRPGDGCTRTDVYSFPHEHWCHDCGTVITFASGICARMNYVPRCGFCGSTDWRSPAPTLPEWIYS